MKSLSAIILLLYSFTISPNPSIYQFTAEDILGIKVPLSTYKGKVILIVNVASQCKLHTPQYAELQELYEKYYAQGLVILGFPANNFKNQEPGSNDEIRTFCSQKYAVTFPMFAKISVQGNDIHPLYKFLTSKKENGVLDAPIKWNFQKFLIDREGKVVASFNPKTHVTDKEVMRQLEKLLKQ